MFNTSIPHILPISVNSITVINHLVKMTHILAPYSIIIPSIYVSHQGMVYFCGVISKKDNLWVFTSNS